MNIRKRRSDRSGRAPLPSPGRPSVAGRDERRRFWAAIAVGMASEDAAVEAGVSQAVGTRWFREAGGMPPAMFGLSGKPLSGRYLSLAEREEIALLRVQGYSIQEIARRLGRAASTISRELRRNRRHTKWRLGVSCDDGAVARRAIRSSSEAGETCAQLGIAHLRGRTTGWCCRRSERSFLSRPGRILERPPAWAATGPTVGPSMEPGTDRSPLADRLPGRRDHAHQP